MNKQEYLEKLNELNFDKNKYCIISGGTMIMYGLRENTSDIDIKVLPEYFNEISLKYHLKNSKKYSYLFELSDDIEVAVKEFDSNDVVWIDGYPVESIQKQLEWKKQNNREKDINDIKLIEKYLKLNK